MQFGGCLSDSLSLPYGIPQGSCLGLLLFTIYTSELFEVLRGHLPDVHAYADDTQLYLSFKPNSDVDQHDAITAMEPCVKAIRNWMLVEKLKLNDDITEFFDNWNVTAVGESQSRPSTYW